jgi:acyl-CoA synthetase (AMP-forming)/AMP-acid ligase II
MIYSVLDYLEEAEYKFPNKTVFEDEKNSITYADLKKNAKKIGTKILNRTKKATQQPIVVFVERNIESLVSFMGVAYSGNFYVPIDIQMPKLRIELILQTLNPIATVVLKSDLVFANSVAPNLLTIIYEEAIFRARSGAGNPCLSVAAGFLRVQPDYTRLAQPNLPDGIPGGHLQLGTGLGWRH